MTTTLAAWLHTLDPVILRISGELAIRWYGLSYVAAFLIGWTLWKWLARRGVALTPADRVGDAMLAVIVGTMVGGRLGYVLIYGPHLLTEFTAAPPFWGVLALNKGGMASHGGMVGLVLAAWWVARGYREIDPVTRERVVVGRCPGLHVMDVLALIAPPGLFLGRCANFINGELLGKIVSPPGTPGPWWSVQFPQELRGWEAPGVRDTLSHTPDLTLEQQRTLFELIDRVRLPGQSVSGAIERLIARAGEHAGELGTLLSSRHPSQLYQAAAEGLLLGLVLWLIALKGRKAGVLAAWFFVVYGVLRVATEFYRLPDPQFGASMRIAGLSRGQWLSVAMVVCGVGLLIFAARGDGARTRGLLAGKPG